VKPGRIFFALPGERVDGFDFCGAAAQEGRQWSWWLPDVAGQRL